jgi:hypothetical protein
MLCQLSYEVKSVRVGDMKYQYPKSRGFDSHSGQANFSACPVWMHTQSTNTHEKSTIKVQFFLNLVFSNNCNIYILIIFIVKFFFEQNLYFADFFLRLNE